MHATWKRMGSARFVAMALDLTGLTQRELGERVGISQVNLSHILHERHEVTTVLRKRIAQEVSAELASRSEPLPPPVARCVDPRAWHGGARVYLRHLPTCPSCLRRAAVDLPPARRSS